MVMCGHRRYEYVSWTGDERVERDADLRASQAERERVVERLRVHAGEGRLEVPELEQRIEAAYGAKTRGELAQLLADLPEPPPSRRKDDPRRVVALGAMAAALAPLVLAIALFTLAPAGLAWMGWPLLGWWFFAGLPAAGFGFASCGHARRSRSRRTVVV
jgi:Domain of unknown function (DUF1707)